MWKTIAIVVLVLILGVLGFAATRPDELTVQRSISIKAEPAKIYPLLVDFNQWQAWSPWEKLDPTMKRTLSGAASGQGAVYAWDGSSKVGAGRMETRGGAVQGRHPARFHQAVRGPQHRRLSPSRPGALMRRPR
jgi:hypothetical protein